MLRVSKKARKTRKTESREFSSFQVRSVQKEKQNNAKSDQGKKNMTTYTARQGDLLRKKKSSRKQKNVTVLPPFDNNNRPAPPGGRGTTKKRRKNQLLIFTPNHIPVLPNPSPAFDRKKEKKVSHETMKREKKTKRRGRRLFTKKRGEEHTTKKIVKEIIKKEARHLPMCISQLIRNYSDMQAFQAPFFLSLE